MKKFFLLLVCVSFTLSGCALFGPNYLEKDVNSLERRVSAVEERQAMLEDQKVSSAGYVPPQIVVEEVKTPSKAYKLPMSARDMQRALSDTGYYYGPIDGKIGKKTKSAIREFQADNNLKVDGVAGPMTQKSILRVLTY